jgi:hypothetical protein
MDFSVQVRQPQRRSSQQIVPQFDRISLHACHQDKGLLCLCENDTDSKNTCFAPQESARGELQKITGWSIEKRK